MKQFYLLAFGLLSLGSSAQNINIPDPGFKNRVIQQNAIGWAKDLNGEWTVIDQNNDDEISVAEAANISYLVLMQSNIASLEGLQYFTNVQTLNLNQNDLSGPLDLNFLSQLHVLSLEENEVSSLAVDQCPLTSLDFAGNQIAALDVSIYPEMISLNCSENNLTELDITNLPLLQSLDCNDNQLVSLDLSQNPLLYWIQFACPTLVYLNIKNGVQGNVQNPTYFGVYGNPSLAYICCDEFEEDLVVEELAIYSIQGVVVNEYCSFEPGGTFYTVSGKFSADLDDNGCSEADPLIPSVRYRITTEDSEFTTTARLDGAYSIPLVQGNYTISPVLETPDAFQITPESIVVSFPQDAAPVVQDFCATGLTPTIDTQIHIIPLIPARPGFDATYKMVYTNTGNTVESGIIELFIQESDRVTLVSSEPAPQSASGNTHTYEYSGLMPFETREVLLTMNINSPVETPAVNVGDQLFFSAYIVPRPEDPTPMNNGSGLKQIVVGSYDPNDKTCTSGPVAGPEVIGEYVDYVIRFENTGNYPAEFVVVKDLIDETQFDVSSLVPISASHDFYTRIEGNKVEFIFENIQLPFDDANNDGYVAFKIKTLPTLAVGDTFSNFASIYFDYNAPVVTDPASTIIEELSAETFAPSGVVVYPNPVSDVLTVALNAGTIGSHEIYDLSGRLVASVIGTNTLDVSGLNAGTYLLKTKSENKVFHTKFLKN